MPDSEGPAGSAIGYHDPEWVAEQLGIDKQTVYKYLQDGTLPGLQLGRKWLISEKALIAHLDDMQRRQTLARRAAGAVPEGFMGKIQDDASFVLILAEIEARQRHHNYIGQEHLLLAIAQSTESLAMKALVTMKVDERRLRASVDSIIGPGDPALGSENESIELTPRARRAIELAYAAAAENQVTPGGLHVLLGIMGEGTGIGAVILRSLGIEHDQFAVTVATLRGPQG